MCPDVEVKIAYSFRTTNCENTMQREQNLVNPVGKSKAPPILSPHDSDDQEDQTVKYNYWKEHTGEMRNFAKNVKEYVADLVADERKEEVFRKDLSVVKKRVAARKDAVKKTSKMLKHNI